MTAVVQVSSLRKTYGTTVAVRDVSFAVEQGEIFGILGPNGAGKTTTVETLAGLRRADAGTVEVLGIDTQRDPAAVRRVLGIQLQAAQLPARMRVGEAVELYASFYPHPADGDELLDMLGLTSSRRTAFADLSGGQKQRLSIALALIGNPRVAVLDELTTGLDPQARRDTWALVERVRDRGVTVVLVTHFMEEAERLCDRLVIIDDGAVVAAGTPAALVAGLDDRRTFRMRLPDGVAVPAGVDSLDGVESLTRVGSEYEVTGGPRVLPTVVLALAEAGIVPDDLRTVSRTLEDVFVQVTGKQRMEVMS